MSGEAVLIAAFSGRALAQSARRAGYAPLVVDGYGDLDTRACAAAVEHVPAFVTRGISKKSVMAAVDRLVKQSAEPPIGIVLGAGFEDRLLLVADIEEDYPLLGNGYVASELCKTPAQFFPSLTRLGIAHPETHFKAPQNCDGWLTKKVGASGGQHIRATTPDDRLSDTLYFQRKAAGDAISVLGIVSPQGDAFAFSRQWTSPTPKTPYRYGGATGPLTLEEDLEARLIDTCLTLAREFNLVGLVSFDFLVDQGEALLIEINPRPGATLDVFDDAEGSLFAAHLTACSGDNPAELLQRQWRPPEARAAAYLYADLGALTVSEASLPDWVADRPAPGTRIAAHAPIATVIAEAETPDAAEQLCFERLGQLQTMLYDSANT